jgi:hypothetical protein
VTNLGKLVLSAANTYSGNTTILGNASPAAGGGTLTLGASSSIGSSPVIDVQQNATFDVSAVTGGFVLGPGQTLKGNGTVIGNVTDNGAISPGASLGNIIFNNNLTLSGANLSIEVDKSLSPSNDVITVLGVLTNTGPGAVGVANIGATPLVIGDSFQIFSQSVSNGQALTVVGGGVVWTNHLAVDGSIAVVSTATSPATNLTIAALGPTSFKLSGKGAPNAVYGIYASPSLTPPVVWTLIGATNSTAGGIIEFVDVQATSTQRFYRFGQ